LVRFHCKLEIELPLHLNSDPEQAGLFEMIVDHLEFSFAEFIQLNLS